MTALQVPDLAEVLAARERIAPYLRATALYRYPELDAMTGAQVRVSTRTISLWAPSKSAAASTWSAS